MGMKRYRPNVDLNELLIYIQLWYLRGALAVLAFCKVEEDAYMESVYNFKMMNKYKKVLSKLF